MSRVTCVRMSCDIASRRDSPGNDVTVTPGCDSPTTSELQNYRYYTQTLVLLSLLYCTHIPLLHLCTVINKIRRQCLYSYLHPIYQNNVQRAKQNIWEIFYSKAAGGGAAWVERGDIYHRNSCSDTSLITCNSNKTVAPSSVSPLSH